MVNYSLQNINGVSWSVWKSVHDKSLVKYFFILVFVIGIISFLTATN